MPSCNLLATCTPLVKGTTKSKPHLLLFTCPLCGWSLCHEIVARGAICIRKSGFSPLQLKTCRLMLDYLSPIMSHRAEGRVWGQRLRRMWPGVSSLHSSMDAASWQSGAGWRRSETPGMAKSCTPRQTHQQSEPGRLKMVKTAIVSETAVVSVPLRHFSLRCLEQPPAT